MVNVPLPVIEEPLSVVAGPLASVRLPFSVPDESVAAPEMVTVLVPLSIPLDRLNVFADSEPFAVTVPPATFRVPLLMVDAFVKVNDPPFTAKMSLP